MVFTLCKDDKENEQAHICFLFSTFVIYIINENYLNYIKLSICNAMLLFSLICDIYILYYNVFVL